MRQYKILLFLFCSFDMHFTLCSMGKPSSHNTYDSIVINPLNLLALAPAMPQELKVRVDECMAKHNTLINALVTSPSPLTDGSRIEKRTDDFRLIERYKNDGILENLSNFNYVLRFKEFPDFVIPITRWGSRLAHLMYAMDQGNIADTNCNLSKVDWSKIEKQFSFQHCSRIAHNLRLQEVIERNDFQFIKIVPMYLYCLAKPAVICDENCVVIQKYMPGLLALKNLKPEFQVIVMKNLSTSAMKEIHAAVIYAALWDIAKSLAIVIDDSGEMVRYQSHYYIVDLEQSLAHKPQFFYYRGVEGEKLYLYDVICGLEHFAKNLLTLPEQLRQWIQLTKAAINFQRLCNKYCVYPDFDYQYLSRLVD